MSRRSSRRSEASQTSSARRASLDRENEASALPPFFNTTFSTHRISPLYIGPDGLTPARLEILGHRLRDTLVGDVVRGIQIGLESSETTYGQVGPLRSVKLRWFEAGTVLGDGDATEERESGWRSLPESKKQGLWLQIRHDNASYVALLLPGTSSKEQDASRWRMAPGESATGNGAAQSDKSHFLHLPLVLFRMPVALKNIICEWLSTTFDCRVSKLALGTRTILGVWEDWIQRMGLPTTGPDFQILLAFNAPLAEPDTGTVPDSAAEEDEDDTKAATASGLRTLDITIRAKDLRRFVRAGKAMPVRSTSTASNSWDNDSRERRRLAGSNDDDGWAWRDHTDGPQTQPFTEALGAYLDRHLALKLFHPSVRVIQVSCSGFVLAQSRVKVVRPANGMSDELSRAAWMFVAKLGERVTEAALPTVFT